MESKKPLLTPLLRWFLFAMVLANTAAEMYAILLPIYLTELGASVAQVGMVFTLSSLVPLVLQVLGGWISDSIGRLRAIAIGSVGGVLGYVAMILAPTWQWMLLALGLGYVARSFVGPSFSAFIAEQSTEENRGRVYGLTDMIFHIVTVIGPPLGGFMATRYGFRFMLLVSGGLYTLAAIMRFWMAGTVRHTVEANPQQLSLRSLRTQLGSMLAMLTAGGLITWIFITDGVSDISWRLSGELLPLYVEQFGGANLQQIGYLGSIFGIALMLATVPAGWLADKFSERFTIIGGFFLQFVAFMVLLRAESFLGFALVWAIFGVGIGALSPAYQSIVSKAIPEKMRGTAFGLFRSSLGLISLPAPWIGAQLWERVHPSAPFRFTGFAALLSILLVWAKFKLPEGEDAPLAPEPEAA